MLTYEPANFGKSLNGWIVRLDGKKVGRIIQDAGFVYQPNGTFRDARKWGDRCETLAACKASLAA